MIANIIAEFKDIIRRYKPIKSFYCSLDAYRGSGKDIYPLAWLELPFIGTPVRDGAQFRYQINFDILYLPDTDTNADKLAKMAMAEQDCINIVESIKRFRTFGYSTSVEDYELLSLYEYTDDKASGYRCTMNVVVTNDADLCELKTYFDDDKELEEGKNLPDFDVDDTGCATKNTGFNLNL